MSGTGLVAYAWHQRTSSVAARERVLATLTPAPGCALLATCHRVEAYVVAQAALPLDREDSEAATVRHGADALAHLIAVAAGLDSAIAGEPQILAQVRAAYRAQRPLDPLLLAVFERALHVGRVLRREFGLSSARSVGSLAVDVVIERIGPAAKVVVIGAGEMGNLAVRALASRAARVTVANRDSARANALASRYGATAVRLDEIASALNGADAVISAADTRGELLTHEVICTRLATERPFLVIDLAVPRSISAAARAVLGRWYISVDDLPGARSRMPADLLAAALARCDEEARRFFALRAPARVAAITARRAEADAIRRAKLRRTIARLAHLTERDRAIVEALSSTLTNALIHAETIALRSSEEVTR